MTEPDPTGRHSEVIEITPEMIAAGVDELLNWSPESRETLVICVYEAMARART